MFGVQGKLAACSLVLLAGCTDDFASLLGPADAGEGGSADGSIARDGGDAAAPTFLCGDAGALVVGCGECSGAPVLCAASHTCVATCSSCSSGPIACTTCDGGAFVSTCSPDLSPAASCPPSGCACATTASTCPLDVQVCLGGSCRTCGDVGTRDTVCRGGTGTMKCKDGTEPKVENRYTCR